LAAHTCKESTARRNRPAAGLIWISRRQDSARTVPGFAPSGSAAVSGIIDFRTPAAGFDEPLALWQACHQRVLRMVGLLERVRERLQQHAPDEAVRVSAASIRRYFNEAAPRHHDDEEVDLFPLLLRRLGEQAPGEAHEQIVTALDSLRTDHVSLGNLWAALEPVLARIERGERAELEETTVALFATGYRRHCDIEDSLIHPALAHALTAEDFAAVGRSMAHRRGADWESTATRRR
jgi:hemerythrin-like domain-containing protein